MKILSILRWSILIFCWYFSLPTGCNADGRDSIRDASYIARNIQYDNKYTFIDYNSNYITTGADALNIFFDALKYADTRKVKVVHIGDSHVQADIITGTVRNRLQQVFGAGGRGLIFPYASANTHPGYDYSTYSRGTWEYARNIHKNPSLDLGLSGVSIRTTDSKAGFKIVFNRFYNDASKNNRLLKIYCKKSEESFDLCVRYNEKTDTIRVNCRDTYLPYVQLTLPVAPQSIDISIIRDANYPQTFFECYGVSLENIENKGVLYHSVGINGAGFNSIMRQKRMIEELKEMKPELVLLDLGANEYFPAGLDAVSYEDNMRSVIKMIRQASPNTAILLCPSQDIYRSVYHNLEACKPAAELTAKVAQRIDAAFYDYFQVSGGRYSMLKWRANNLAKSDRVHLTFSGYITKGELFANALLNTYYRYLTRTESLPDPAFANIIRTRPAIAAYTPEHSINNEYPKAGHKQLYTIRPGDNLGKIAQTFNVSVAALVEWNRLPSTFIRAGENLVIYTTTNPPTAANTYKSAVPTPTTASKPTTTLPQAVAPQTHIVKSGETLWIIAQKYNTTVDSIRKANNIYHNLIKPGMRLVVKKS